MASLIHYTFLILKFKWVYNSAKQIYHIISCHSIVRSSKLDLPFSSSCPLYPPIFFSLIRWLCLLLRRESRQYQTEKSRSPTRRPSWKGTHSIFLHSYKCRGVNATISPSDLGSHCHLLPSESLTIIYPFISSILQPFSSRSFFAFTHLFTINTRVHFQPLQYPPSFSVKFKEELFSLTVAVSLSPTHATTHSDLGLMPWFHGIATISTEGHAAMLSGHFPGFILLNFQ